MSTKYVMKALIIGLIAVVGFSGCVVNPADLSNLEQSVLAAPTGVTATATSTSRITVSWSAVAGASVYYVYRSDSAGPFNPIAAVNAPSTTFDSAGLAASTTYTYEISAYDPSDGSESPLSSPASATTFDPTGNLGAPTGVTATATAADRISVAWNAVSGATLYYIYRSDGGGPFNAIAATSSTSFDSAGLTTSTNYCYEIQATNAAGASVLSSPACATTFNMNGNLTPPATVSAVTLSSSRINISWSAVSGATTYYIYQSDGGGPFNPVGATTGTTYDAAGLMASTGYCYEIQASNGSANSTLSMPPACATTSAAGLQARWKFDERTGTVTADASGSTFTGFLQGSTTFSTTDVAPILDETAHNRSSLSVPGGTGDFVSVPDNGNFTVGGNDFTVSLWVKGSASGTVHLIGKRAAGCGATNWELGTSGGSFFISGSSTMGFGSLPADTWTHVAVTNTGGIATYYVNGQSVGTGAFTPGPATADPLQIGNAGGCGNGTAVLLDEARLYSSALSAAEVAALGTLPPAPLNLTGTVVSSTRADLSWSAVPNAEMYIIYRGTMSGNEAFLTTAPATTTTYIEGHLMPGQTTSWEVRAVVAGLVSNFSNEVVLTANDAPPAPTNVAATSASQTQIDVTWSAEPSAILYYIYMSTGGGPYIGIGAVSSTSFSAGGLTANTSYSFTVASMDSGGTIGAQSAPASATTQP